MKGFLDFIRKQGVVGLAVGFILGGSISKLVSSLVEDLINPMLGLILGRVNNLVSLNLELGDTVISYGSFLSSFLDFVIIAFVVYFGVKGLGLDKLDKKK